MIRVALSLSSNVSGLLQLLHSTYLQPKQNSAQPHVKAMLQLSHEDKIVLGSMAHSNAGAPIDCSVTTDTLQAVEGQDRGARLQYIVKWHFRQVCRDLKTHSLT